MKPKIAFVMFFGVCLCWFVCFPAQSQSASESTEVILIHATVVDSNIQNALSEHLTLDPNFKASKQLPEDKRDFPPILFNKDNAIEFDWTPGQQARYLMEDIRQGLHQLQSVEKPTGMDGIALAGGREYWPKLRDISCHDKPGIRYYDLDGFEQYCPTK